MNGGQKSVVFVVDDDAAMRDSLRFLFQSVGLDTLVFASASDFHQTELPDVPSCLVVDVRLPGLSGLQLQTELAKANSRIPVIFMTGHGDIRMAATAMKAGLPKIGDRSGFRAVGKYSQGACWRGPTASRARMPRTRKANAARAAVVTRTAAAITAQARQPVMTTVFPSRLMTITAMTSLSDSSSTVRFASN
jgi:CheY-like chemotaxis protein